MFDQTKNENGGKRRIREDKRASDMAMPEPDQREVPGAVTDLKDDVTHLRTVHFSLLATCVALFGLTVAGQSNEYQLALGQLRQIENVLERWKPEWLEAAAAARVPEERAFSTETVLVAPCPYLCVESTFRPYGSAGPKAGIEFRPSTPYERPPIAEGLRLRFDSNWTLLPLPLEFMNGANLGADPLDRNGPLWSHLAKPERRDRHFPTPVPKEYPAVFERLELSKPVALEDFEKLWDTLAQVSLTVTFATKLNGRVMVGRVNEGVAVDWIEPTNIGEPSWPLVTLRLEPIDENLKAWWRDQTEHQLKPDFQFIGHTAWGVVSLPAKVRRRSLDAQKAFLEQYEIDWVPASFAVNFPELSVLSEGFKFLSLDKVRAGLVTGARRSQKDVTLFGLSIPAVFVAKWGGVIVIVVQLYFLLHLRRFRQRLGSARGAVLAPWIGTYPDLASKGAMMISALAAPPVFLALVIARDFQSNPALAGFVIGSLLLAGLSFPVLRGVWRQLERQAEG